MDPGKLRDKVDWLRLTQDGPNLAFAQYKTVWARVKETGLKNLFSKVGVGADGVEVLLRRQGLTLDDCLLYKGERYFLTNIAPEGLHPVYDKVQAARVPLHRVTVYRHRVGRGPLGQAMEEDEPLGSFPGWVTEKYLASREEDSHTESTARFVVVSPKAALYRAGDFFDLLGGRYRVMVAHCLESHKNEYEVQKVGDD